MENLHNELGGSDTEERSSYITKMPEKEIINYLLAYFNNNSIKYAFTGELSSTYHLNEKQFIAGREMEIFVDEAFNQTDFKKNLEKQEFDEDDEVFIEIYKTDDDVPFWFNKKIKGVNNVSITQAYSDILHYSDINIKKLLNKISENLVRN